MSQNSELLVMTTGGTFEKEYDLFEGELTFDRSHLDEIIDRTRVSLPVATATPFLVDSLDMTERQRTDIVDACAAAEQDRIVIIHGTDTMVETAQAIKQARLEMIARKTIVLTGAMIPYSLGVRSDALFNFGTALAFAQTLPPDVYISMNGRHFTSDNVHKNKALGMFQELPRV